MSRSIQIYDTTLRDGTQGEGVSLSLQDKLQITRRLDEIGVDFVEGGYPLSNPKDAEFFQKARQLDLKNATVCAFGMTRRKGIKASDDPGMKALLEAVLGLPRPTCTIVGKTWDFHVTEVLRVSLAENLDMIADTIEFLRSRGCEVIYDAEHFFDGFRANVDHAAKTIQTAAQAGAKMVVLCDTNGGTLPEHIAEYTRAAQNVLSMAGNVPVGIHCHNDCELAVANSLAAVDAGASQVQGTINGLGERCGNADLISVMSNLALKKGYTILGGRQLDHLTELSRYVYEMANLNLRSNQPFVGQSAFAHKGGMHVHAIARATSTYEHIDPALVGNERRILVSELSGRSNIAALTSRHNLGDDKKLMDAILKQVVDLEAQGYQFETADASFDLLVQRVAGTFVPHFERIKYHVDVENEAGGQTVTEATVKLRVNGQERHEVAEGDGPVNALDAAMRKALNGRFPGLAEMRLTDYKVRVVNSEAGTAARIRVSIESSDHHDVWGTIGVSENIIEASWLALVDAIEYKLWKDGQTKG
jgi:2-isopropylmalate synthase